MDQPAPKNLGDKRLTHIHAIGQSLAIGPMFSAGLLTGLVASVAGFSTPLSVLLGAIGAICLAYVISLYARRYAGAGAMYEYLARGAHSGVGVFCAGLYGSACSSSAAVACSSPTGSSRRPSPEPPVDQHRVVGVGGDRARDRGLPQPFRRPSRDPGRPDPRHDLRHPVPDPRGVDHRAGRGYGQHPFGVLHDPLLGQQRLSRNPVRRHALHRVRGGRIDRGGGT